MASTRWRISPAALLVKVIARIPRVRPALPQQPGDDAGDHALRLAAAGLDENQQWAFEVGDRLALGGRQVSEQVRMRRARARLGVRGPGRGAGGGGSLYGGGEGVASQRGPLHGIPIGIKDIYDVFDWPTAAGSRLWKNSYARQDATAVRKLREAGAVFVGKTVTTQYASFDPPPTRNPWNVDHTPGGSSSGSAAAVATGMCFGALGSQTGGSITRPASFCGVCGLKPTYGRVSADGVVPLAASMDHVGPMARCVRDLALILQVIAGPDPLDPAAAESFVPD